MVLMNGFWWIKALNVEKKNDKLNFFFKKANNLHDKTSSFECFGEDLKLQSTISLWAYKTL